MNKGIRKVPQLYFLGGLSIAVGSSILNRYLPLYHLLHALIFGIGIGLMLWGIYLMRRGAK